MKNIKTINKEDKQIIQSMIEIGEYSFASDYLNKEYIMTYIEDAKSFILVYEENHQVLGFSICSMWRSDELFKHTEGFHSALWAQNIKKKDEMELGLIKTIAVDLKFRHKGIGTELFRVCEEKLMSLGTKHSVIPAWVYADTMPLEKVLKKFHYKP